MSEKTFALKGIIVQTPEFDKIEFHNNAYVVVKDGISQGIFDKLPEEFKDVKVYDYSDQLVFPGMCDMHLHAPQYGFRGMGECVDNSLGWNSWFEHYCFPEEVKYKDIEYARKAYSRFVDDLVKTTSTTRIAAFATIHREATEFLMKKLDDAGTDFRMVFVGGGTDREAIVAYARELGLVDKVFFVDPIRDRDRIRAWYCRADLFLFPSTFDTNGLVVREAAACGLGSVLVGGSCAAEDVSDGINGLLIEENADSMAVCLQAVCRNPEKMREVGENAQRDIYISWDTAVRGAVERYGTVIENYRAGRYPKHETARDDLFRGIGELMNLIGTGEERREAIREHISDVLAGRAPKTEWRHPFDAAVTNEVFRNMRNTLTDRANEAADRKRKFEAESQASLSEIRAGLEAGREKARQRRAELEQNLENFYDIFL